MLVSEQVEQLNRDCYCYPLDSTQLIGAIEKSQPVVTNRFAANWFAGTGVLVAASDVEAMLGVVESIESLVRLPLYQSARTDARSDIEHWRYSDGMLMGYDFHLGSNGPQLIEVNSNAGGAFIVNEMMQQLVDAVPQCCGIKPLAEKPATLKSLILKEWHSAGRVGSPERAAIVDDDPEAQFLYPDMLIAKDYFENSGIETIVAGVSSLTYDGGRVMCKGQPVDIIYNRSTDFYMSGGDHQALRDAAKAGAVVVGPNPMHHALYADKKNFIDFTDQQCLESYGLPEHHRLKLRDHVPSTWLLTPDNATDLYARRRTLYFKPVDGYGSKAVYRGDKITRRVWSDILNRVDQGQGYIAQEIVRPSLRAVVVEGERRQLKFDVRIYTAGGVAVMAAARVYQGQTTNFRTSGGGFAPVLYIPESSTASADCRAGNGCDG